jgi:hypothetical protein
VSLSDERTLNYFETAQEARRWLITAETWVQSWISSSEIPVGRSGTGIDFLRVPWFCLLIFIALLLHTHQQVPPPHEVCDNPDQAAHYYTLGPNLGASI